MVEQAILGMLFVSASVLGILAEPGIHKEQLAISGAIFLSASMIISVLRKRD